MCTLNVTAGEEEHQRLISHTEQEADLRQPANNTTSSYGAVNTETHRVTQSDHTAAQS